MLKTITLPQVTFGAYLLRTLKEDDYLDYYEIGKNAANIHYLTWSPFKKYAEAKEAIKQYLMRKWYQGPIGYGIIFNDKLIGVIEFHTFSDLYKTAEIGYLLHQDYWNKGIMTSALEKVCYIGFTILELNKIVIRSIKENIASLKVIEKNGFKLVKILKNAHYHKKTACYYDIYQYQLERDDFFAQKTKRNL